MRYFLIFFLSLFLWISSYSQGWRHEEKEILVTISGEDDLQTLVSVTPNIEPAAADGRKYRAYVIQDELNKLKSTGLAFEITIPDLNRHYEHFWDNPLVPAGYYTYEEIIAIADSLALNFPAICKKEIWGTSVGGRSLVALKISDNVSDDEPEAEIMFDGGIHGDEVGGSQNIIMFARDLCLNYNSDPGITDLVNNREIWLYLMVNPDGRVSMSRYNNNNVDINRDNGYMWNGEGFSTAAWSQAETRALRDGILRHQFVLYTNYHSGIEIISYPWSYRGNQCRDYYHLNNLASIYSQSGAYEVPLAYGQGFNVMYPINGSTKDYQYGSLGHAGWSIEISTDKQPPSSQISYYYHANKPSMLEVIRQCGYGISGMVKDTLTGEAVQATVWPNNFYPVYTDPVVGDYHKYLMSGNCNIRVTANGYKPKLVSNLMIPNQNSLTTDFQLVPDTGWYAYKVLSCRIPGNNFGDEGYTPGCLGAPDNVPYSLGRNGWVILDMGDTIYNGPGADFRVIQSGSQLKNFTVSGSSSQDGPFITIGTSNGTAAFDLDPTSLDKVRYIQIKDNNSSPATGNGAGYNLDAVAMITPPLKVRFSASDNTPCQGAGVDFTDQSTGNPVSWNWSFPGAVPSFSNQKNPTGIVYPQTGIYPVTLTISNGISAISATKQSYITVSSAPEVSLGNDTLVCGGQTVELHAGNPGSRYLWSTGDTTESILADSTGTGFGIGEFWVNATAGNGCRDADTIRITWDDCTGTGQFSTGAGILILPNPAKDHIQLRINGLNGGEWQLLTLAGNLLKQGRIDGERYQHTVNVSGVPHGICMIRVVRDGYSTVKKVVIIPDN